MTMCLKGIYKKYKFSNDALTTGTAQAKKLVNPQSQTSFKPSSLD